MVEKSTPIDRREPLNLGVVDTYVFDYGGVVSHHYCEPWQSNLSTLLGVTPQKVKGLLSESGSLGKDYRLGRMTRDAFWQNVIDQACGYSVDPSELEYNWAMSYQIYSKMIDLTNRLRTEVGQK